MKGFLVGSLALIVLYTLLESSDKLSSANSAIANLVHNLLSGDHAAIHVHAPTAAAKSGSSTPSKTPTPSSGTPPILV